MSCTRGSSSSARSCSCETLRGHRHRSSPSRRAGSPRTPRSSPSTSSSSTSRVPRRSCVRLVRAGNPRPGAWLDVDGARLKVWRAHDDDGRFVPDEVQPEASGRCRTPRGGPGIAAPTRSRERARPSTPVARRDPCARAHRRTARSPTSCCPALLRETQLRDPRPRPGHRVGLRHGPLAAHARPSARAVPRPADRRARPAGARRAAARRVPTRRPASRRTPRSARPSPRCGQVVAARQGFRERRAPHARGGRAALAAARGDDVAVDRDPHVDAGLDRRAADRRPRCRRRARGARRGQRAGRRSRCGSTRAGPRPPTSTAELRGGRASPSRRGELLADALLVSRSRRPRSRCRRCRDGRATPQDQASQAVAALVGAQPGERVLEIGAAPGGKATAIAERDGRRRAWSSASTATRRGPR